MQFLIGSVTRAVSLVVVGHIARVHRRHVLPLEETFRRMAKHVPPGLASRELIQGRGQRRVLRHPNSRGIILGDHEERAPADKVRSQGRVDLVDPCAMPIRDIPLEFTEALRNRFADVRGHRAAGGEVVREPAVLHERKPLLGKPAVRTLRRANLLKRGNGLVIHAVHHIN